MKKRLNYLQVHRNKKPRRVMISREMRIISRTILLALHVVAGAIDNYKGRKNVHKLQLLGDEYRELVKERHLLYESQTFNERYFEIDRRLRELDREVPHSTAGGGNYVKAISNGIPIFPGYVKGCPLTREVFGKSPDPESEQKIITFAGVNQPQYIGRGATVKLTGGTLESREGESDKG